MSSTQYAKSHIPHALCSVGQNVGCRIKRLLSNELTHEARPLHASTTRAPGEELFFFVCKSNGQNRHLDNCKCMSFVCQLGGLAPPHQPAQRRSRDLFASRENHRKHCCVPQRLRERESGRNSNPSAICHVCPSQHVHAERFVRLSKLIPIEAATQERSYASTSIIITEDAITRTSAISSLP